MTSQKTSLLRSLLERYEKHGAVLAKSADLEAFTLTNTYLAAMGGDVHAQTMLAFRYLHGLGVEKSCSNAGRYYSIAARAIADQVENSFSYDIVERKHLPLQLIGVDEPIEESQFLQFNHYQAQNGNPEAHKFLGESFLYGVINKQDFSQARKYLKLALKGMPDNRDLLYYLGDLSVHGLGVNEPNYTRAFNYFSRCSSMKDMRCVNGLGFVFYTVPPEKENEA